MKKSSSADQLSDLHDRIEYKLSHLHDGETGVKLHQDPYKSVTSKGDHIVDTWDKHQLFDYLHNQRIFPDVDEDLETIRQHVKQMYDESNQHLSR